MSNPSETPSYAQELEQRLDELIHWAVAQQPHTISRVDVADFSQVREEFLTLAKSGVSPKKEDARVPEPSEGGPQYINDNPTPWP